MPTTTSTTTPATLTARAVSAARNYRDTAPHEWADRHTFRLQWDRRAMMGASVAAALGIGIDAVIVCDDPTRSYGVGRNTSAGDLIEVTSDDGRCWYFIPDLTGHDPLWGWLLLGECPYCEAAHVPVARVAGLADLGDHLDPKTDHGGVDSAPEDFHGDPGHHPHCNHARHGDELAQTGSTAP